MDAPRDLALVLLRGAGFDGFVNGVPLRHGCLGNQARRGFPRNRPVVIGVTRDVRLQNRDAEIPLGLSQMRSSFIGVFPLLVVGLPPVQVGLLAALWWPHLARPWLFLVLGLTALYGMVGLLACWVFGNIGIAGKSSAVPPEARPLSIDAQLLFGFVAVVVVGSAVLFGLKVLFAKG